MSFRKLFTVTAAFALLGIVAGTSNGCGSSSVEAADAASDGPTLRHPDGSVPETGTGGDDGGGGGPQLQFDGTTGQACTRDMDCKGLGAGAPGVNKCSTSATVFTSGEIYPSGVCLDPMPCDPCGGTSPCDNYIHGCDGTGPSAPGICLRRSDGTGVCLPGCFFSPDGQQPQGCVGKDVCQPYGYGAGTQGVVGVGYCFGGCTADSDCVTGEKCETVTGLCLKNVTPPTKNIGASCTAMDAQMNPAPCNCVYNTQTSMAGFCTQACTVGGNQCPSGWFCEAYEPTTLSGANDASVAAFGMQNAGLGGVCVPSCQVGGGTPATDASATGGDAAMSTDAASTDAAPMGTDAGTCPPNSTCQVTFAGGPGCIP